MPQLEPSARWSTREAWPAAPRGPPQSPVLVKLARADLAQPRRGMRGGLRRAPALAPAAGTAAQTFGCPPAAGPRRAAPDCRCLPGRPGSRRRRGRPHPRRRAHSGRRRRRRRRRPGCVVAVRDQVVHTRQRQSDELNTEAAGSGRMCSAPAAGGRANDTMHTAKRARAHACDGKPAMLYTAPRSSTSEHSVPVHTTPPHSRQWCFRNVNEKPLVQCGQACTRDSSSQGTMLRSNFSRVKNLVGVCARGGHHVACRQSEAPSSF